MIWTILAFLVAFLPAGLGLIASAQLSKRSEEEWKLLAWVPNAPSLAWWGFFLIGVLRDPTSHNLWPFEMIISTGASAVLFVVFLVARRLLMTPAKSRSPFHR